MKVDWKGWKDTLNMGFMSLPILGVISIMEEHDPILHYGSIIFVIIYTGLYIFVRVKASRKEVYSSEGKTL